MDSTYLPPDPQAQDPANQGFSSDYGQSDPVVNQPPVADAATIPAAPAAPAPASDFEALDIFTILGVAEDDPDKDAFRSELEDAIWEEIMEREVADKLSDEELEHMDQVLLDENKSAEEQRNAMFGLLAEKLPNMDEVIRRYTTQAKTDLLYERVEGMKEYFQNQGDQAKLDQVNRASQLFEQGEYVATVTALNAIQ